LKRCLHGVLQLDLHVKCGLSSRKDGCGRTILVLKEGGSGRSRSSTDGLQSAKRNELVAFEAGGGITFDIEKLLHEEKN
jgi:hypothetical protein